MTVELSIGYGLRLSFDPTRLFPNWESLTPAQKRVVVLGVGNACKDSHAGILYKEPGKNGRDFPEGSSEWNTAHAAKMTRAQETLELLYKGEARAFGERTGDPIESRFNELIRKAAYKALRAKGHSSKEATGDRLKAEMESIKAKNGESFKKVAKAQVEQEVKLAKTLASSADDVTN